MAMNIEVAISLVKQAIDQDKKKNYEEAARCYRDALIQFKAVSKYGGISNGVKNAIISKCQQYEDRLKKLNRYLLTNADLSQLFKDVCSKPRPRPDSQNSTSSISSDLRACPLFRAGMENVEKAKKGDKKGDFEEALNFYEEGMALLMDVHQDDEEVNQQLRFKCLLIHERIEIIRNYLDQGGLIKVNT